MAAPGDLEVRRKPPKIDLGEAISFDSVLTVLTVLLVLRMIFLIPMVNVDKAKLEQVRRDSIWIHAARRIELAAAAPDSLALPYAAVFGLQGCHIVVEREQGGGTFVSALAADSTLTLVEHAPQGSFTSLRVQRSNEHPVFRRGRLLWSPGERTWFATADTTDYGKDPSSVAFLARVRAREDSR